MRILMITAQYLPEVFGGAEQQCRKLSSRLAANNIHVTILTSRKNRTIPMKDNMDGVKIVRLNAYGPPQLLSLRYFYASLLWVIKAVCWGYKNRKTYDLIHVHQAKLQAFVGLVIAGLTKKRSIIKIGNSGSGFDLLTLKRKAFIGNFLYRYIVRNADIVIAISTNICKELINTGISSHKIIFLPNGVEMSIDQIVPPEEKDNYRNDIKLPLDKKIFLFVGRLEKQKDILLLIDSFASAEPLKNKWLLILVGDGDLRYQIENLVNKHEINEAVLLAGYQKNILPYLLASDFFILSTKTEGLSNALLEAMSVGLVPISTDVSGSNDLIKHGSNGFLTEINSMESLRNAIGQAGRLSKEEIYQFGEKSMMLIKEKYEMDIITKHYIQLYKSIDGKI